MKLAIIALKPAKMRNNGTQQPMAFPILRCRPDRVNGMPICLDNFPFAAEIPKARFQENDKPGMPFFFRPITHLKVYAKGCPTPRVELGFCHARDLYLFYSSHLPESTIPNRNAPNITSLLPTQSPQQFLLVISCSQT
jgi:hypothetical protein